MEETKDIKVQDDETLEEFGEKDKLLLIKFEYDKRYYGYVAVKRKENKYYAKKLKANKIVDMDFYREMFLSEYIKTFKEISFAKIVHILKLKHLEVINNMEEFNKYI